MPHHPPTNHRLDPRRGDAHGARSHCGVRLSRAAAADVTERLVAAGCVAAEEEADELLAAAPDKATLDAWLRRREVGEPLAWIVGTQRFCGRTLRIDSGVYVPRTQSEELAYRAGELLPAEGRAVDLCTGAGAIAVYLATRVPTATIIGIDIDVRAAACARRNGVRSLAADLDRPLRGDLEFDVVTAVAPYVPTGELRLLPADVQRYEPRLALDGGEDGLDVVRRIVAAAGRLLCPGGWLLTEVGGRPGRGVDRRAHHGRFRAPRALAGRGWRAPGHGHPAHGRRRRPSLTRACADLASRPLQRPSRSGVAPQPPHRITWWNQGVGLPNGPIWFLRLPARHNRRRAVRSVLGKGAPWTPAG